MGFKYDILKLTSYLVIFITIYLVMMLTIFKDTIRNNWSQYQCNPSVMPFASFFGFDTMENLQVCLGSSFKSSFEVLLKPFSFMIVIITKIFGNIIDQLNSIRTIMAPIRSFVKTASSMVFRKIEDIMGVIIFNFLKINNLMKRVFSNFRLALYTLEATQMTMNSTWNGPIGQLTRFWAKPVDFMTDFFCFDGDTQVYGKPISRVNIGDGSGNVYGVLKTLAPAKIYNYNGTLVSGNHFVYHGGYWMMVKDTGVPLVDYHGEYLYSLYTRDHKLTIGNTLFADYTETDHIQRAQKEVHLRLLGSKSQQITGDENLLHSDIRVLDKGGNFIKISDIEPGLELFGGRNRVIGVVKQRVNLKCNRRGWGINNIVWNNGGWILVSDITPTHEIQIMESTFYNIITERGYYITDSFIVRDYFETTNSKSIDLLALMTQELLNTSPFQGILPKSII